MYRFSSSAIFFLVRCLLWEGDNVRSSIKGNERGSRHVLLRLHILEYFGQQSNDSSFFSIVHQKFVKIMCYIKTNYSHKKFL